MKQTTVQIKFDAERYSALLRYAAKKNISIEQELLDCLEKQYKKIVPPDVRDYIENRDEPPKAKSGSGKQKPENDQSEDAENSDFAAESSPQTYE